MVKPKGKNVGVLKPPLHIIIYAAGFDYRNWYKSQVAELQAVYNKIWLPTTVDFEAAAYHIAMKLPSRKIFGAKNMNDFIKILGQQNNGSISTIYIIAHGKQGIVYFSGKPGSKPGTWIGDPKSAFNPFHKGIKNIRKKFIQKAKIIFYACESGSMAVDGKDPLQFIANKFGVTAQGFSHDIIWDIYFHYVPLVQPVSQAIIAGSVNITAVNRGKVYCGNQVVDLLCLNPDVTRKPQPQQK
ncbi:MAG: hypothetical protein QW454_05490 [Candidatus Bathyarchaeia archaeon]